MPGADKAKWGSKFEPASCNNVMGPSRTGPGACRKGRSAGNGPMKFPRSVKLRHVTAPNLLRDIPVRLPPSRWRGGRN